MTHESCRDASDRVVDSHIDNIRRKIAALKPARACIASVVAWATSSIWHRSGVLRGAACVGVSPGLAAGSMSALRENH
jgi:hypothetical protein